MSKREKTMKKMAISALAALTLSFGLVSFGEGASTHYTGCVTDVYFKQRTHDKKVRLEVSIGRGGKQI